MEDCQPICTPMVIGCSLSSNDEPPIMNQLEYIFMIGSLLYLTSIRPYIMYVVGIIRRFQANLKEKHLRIVKRIFKYLQGTQDFGLWYPKDTDPILHAYIDAIGLEMLMTKKALVEVHFIWDHD